MMMSTETAFGMSGFSTNSELPVKAVQPPPIPLWRKLCHWGPIAALGIISTVSTSGIMCLLEWWHPLSSGAALLNFVVFVAFNFFVMTNFFAAIETGPGYVPVGWMPEDPEDIRYLQFCDKCQCYKVPRSHHCRKCGRCCLKMDHHCPWINNCTGHSNHGLFIRFLFFAVMGHGHGALILGPSIYRAVYRVWYIFYGTGLEPVVQLSVYAILYCIFAFGLAMGVVVSVGYLLWKQLKHVYNNRTAIEEWIVENAKQRDKSPNAPAQLYPYDLGWREHFHQVFTWNGPARGDGIHWAVSPGSDPYALTIEQIKQKSSKHSHKMDVYQIVRPYSGSWFPVIDCGPRVALHPPFTDDQRLPVELGDRINVNKWKKYWLYGERLPSVDKQNYLELRMCGWFPRMCAVKMDEKKGD